MSSAFLRSSCAARCSFPKWNGTPLHVRWTKGLAHFTKFRMNIRHTPMVPRNVWTSEMSLQGPHLVILSTYLGLGSRPCRVQRCLTAMISSAQRTDLGPLKVPPQYLMHCTTRLRLWKCSHTKRWMPGLAGMRSSLPSAKTYCVSELRIG